MYSVIVAQRIADQLRRIHPRHTAKKVAREVPCDPRTVKGWLSGQMPANEHFLSLAARYGRAFTLAALEPVIGRETQEELDHRLERVEEEIAAMREGLKGDSNGDCAEICSGNDEPLALDRRIREPSSTPVAAPRPNAGPRRQAGSDAR